MSHDLLLGLAQAVDDAGIATYRPDTAYQPDETAVVFDVLPAAPDRVLMLSVYHNADHPTIAIGRVRVQVWCRGLPNRALDAADLAWDFFQVFHGLTHQDYGSVHATQILRTSSVTLGQDDSRRPQQSDNYVIDACWPATANRPD